MFNRKRIKELKKEINALNSRLTGLEVDNLRNEEAIDLLADEMGFEIESCDCCGELFLNKE